MGEEGVAVVVGVAVDVVGSVAVVPPEPEVGFSVPVAGVVAGLTAGVEGDVAVTGGTATIGGAIATVLSPPPLPPHPDKASAQKLPKTKARASAGVDEQMSICILLTPMFVI